MLPLPRPPLTACAARTYACADIRTLYHWLEAHGYHYSGTFGPYEYGRFAYAELALDDTGRRRPASGIEVHLNGTVVAADNRAQQLLASIVAGCADRSC